ncbi:MAG: GDSL-type esterase/lipase family protein [Ruthenibacterium sp.]
MLCNTKDGLLPMDGTLLILGDSISDLGHYVSILNCYLAITQNVSLTLINAGVSSETCCGLSEPAHPFLRPCVQSRVQSALEKTKPDWVLIGYGVNDGIYYPFSQQRFAAYQNGITSLIHAVHASGARCLVMTPLCFDASADGVITGGDDETEYSFMKPYVRYDDVLARYADWVMQEASALADAVMDVRTPFLADLAAMRRKDSTYVSGDGIHPSRHGHYTVAKTLLHHLFGVQTESLETLLLQDNSALFDLMYARDQLLHAYYKEWIGHENPNKSIVPEDWAQQAAALDGQIDAYLAAKPHPWTVHGTWEGFDTQTFFNPDGYEVIVAAPKTAAAGRPWVWRAEFFGAFPTVDLALLQRGWHVAQLRIPDLYGCPAAVALMERFRAALVALYKLSAKAVLFGFSRGGLYAVNYAASYPQHVRLLYLDAPVVDMESWPGGKYSGIGGAEEWRQCKAIYGAMHDEAARKAQGCDSLLAAKLPLALVAGDSDTVVPYCENGAFLTARYQDSGVPFLLFLKKGCDHHPHSVEGAKAEALVAFILENAGETP